MYAAPVIKELSCDGELHLEHQGQRLQFTAIGSKLQLMAPSLAILRTALRMYFQPQQHVSRLLRQAGLHLVVYVKQVEVARMGTGVESNWLGSIAGLPGTSVSFTGLLRTILR